MENSAGLWLVCLALRIYGFWVFIAVALALTSAPFHPYIHKQPTSFSNIVLLQQLFDFLLVFLHQWIKTCLENTAQSTDPSNAWSLVSLTGDQWNIQRYQSVLIILTVDTNTLRQTNVHKEARRRTRVDVTTKWAYYATVYEGWRLGGVLLTQDQCGCRFSFQPSWSQI